MFFSIIIPVYKTEDYLRKCIASILNQSFTNYEVILINDGSPDNCGSICDEYAKIDSRITVIHKQNGGVSSARNEALKIATGEYIWFIDSDDYIEENSLEILSQYIEKTPTDLYVFEHGFFEKYYITDLNRLFNDHYFKYHFGFEPWNKIYKTSIIKNNHLLFDTTETVGEDLLFNVNYYTKIKSCLFIDERLYHYVIRENSAMNSKDSERYKKQMRLFFKIHKTLKSSVSEEILAILFIMHIISGLNQSFDKFSLITYRKVVKNYLSQIQFDKKIFKAALNKFFKNENASFLGKFKIRLLFFNLK